jgi:uncharacterized protein GlcG (DUF336 family)
MKQVMILAGVLAMSSLAAGAQAPSVPAATAPAAPTPPARQPPPADELPLAVAMQWAQATIAACRANGYGVTATYMNSAFDLKLVLRSDGTPAGTVEVARRKAYTVIKTGMSSGDYAASVGFPAGTPLPPTAPGQPRGLPPGPNPDPNMIILAGGLPVKVNGRIIGAVSASGAPGGDKDAACVQAGLNAIADQLK